MFRTAYCMLWLECTLETLMITLLDDYSCLYFGMVGQTQSLSLKMVFYLTTLFVKAVIIFFLLKKFSQIYIIYIYRKRV